MKRLSAVVAVMLLSCTSRSVQPVSSLVGANDMVQVGSLLFVTSSERAQLRALDLEPGPLTSQPRQFVPAPNPLEPLAIPVLARPTMLTADVSWLDGGVEAHGPLVYAASNGGSEISIVGGGRKQLVELMRLPLNSPITAVAGFYDGTVSRLYFATFDGALAQLQRVTLPDPAQLPSLPVGSLLEAVESIAIVPNVVISSLIVLPNGRLALAERTAQGAAGPTVVLDLGTLALREMHFSGPVRSLSTNGGSDALEAGDRLYGILDAELCGNSSCAGIESVDVATGQISLDASGHQMLPINVGVGLPVSFSLAPGARLNSPVDGGYQVMPRQILGVTSVSNGTLVYWEAGGLLPIDVNPDPAAVIAGSYYDPAGNPVDIASTPAGAFFADGGVLDFSSISLGDGAARDEGIAVVVEGQIPGLVGLAFDAAGHVSAPGVGSRAAVGDAAVFTDASGVDCAEASVLAVSADAVEVTPQPCGATVSIRARGTQPYVVTGTVSGYFFRSGPGQTGTYAGTYLFHTPSFDPSVPQLQIRFGDATGLPRDSKWLVTVDDDYVPYVASVDPTAAGCAAPTTFPGAVVADGARERTFIAFPSANGIIETDNTLVLPTTLVTSVFCYR